MPRILIAEDSELFAAALAELFGAEPDLELVARVDNGADAVAQTLELRPDLVIMDIQMPRLDGLAATEQIMAQAPTPILVVTSDPWRGGVDLSFKALSAGALDLVGKPGLLPTDAAGRATFLRKVRLLAQIPVIRHVRGRDRPGPAPPEPARRLGRPRPPGRGAPLVGIIGSTGGPKALARLFDELPGELPASLLIVQHITRGFTEHLARWLDAHSALRVREAIGGLEPAPATAYIAPSGHHLELDESGRLKLRAGERAGGHCPNGDVLLESLSAHAPRRTLGLILSGMGEDGARGLASLRRAGAPTLAQDEASSVVWGMPRAALEREAVEEVVELDRLAEAITARVEAMRRSKA